MAQTANDLLDNNTVASKGVFGGLGAEFEKALARDAKLIANRKKRPPNYYNSLGATEQTINGTTEEALIVTSAQAKKKAVTYLKEMASVKSVTNDYNDLLTEYTEARNADSSTVISDLDLVTGKFNAFRVELLKQPEIEVDVKSGFSPALDAMVRALGRLGLKDRRERFHNLFDTVAREQYIGAQTDELKKELRSWIRVFVTYP